VEGCPDTGVEGWHPGNAMCDAIGDAWLQPMGVATGVCGPYTCADCGVPTGCMGFCCRQPPFATGVCVQPGNISVGWLQTPKPRACCWAAPAETGVMSCDGTAVLNHCSCISPCMFPQLTGEVGPGTAVASGRSAGVACCGLAVLPNERCIAICPRAWSHSR